MGTYEKLAGLPLEIEDILLEGMEQQFSPEFTRMTTLVRMQGGGHEGIGEDVTYDVLDHVALQDAGPPGGLHAGYTLDSFSKRLDQTELWPSPPVRDASRDYRRWAFESAALDLALRQAGTSLAEQVEREPRPLTFVVSMRLGSFDPDEPETAERLHRLLELYPSTRVKLDPTNKWTPELIDEIVATGAVDSLDLKGQYKGTPVDVETDPELYRLLIEKFPNAWLEDPDVTAETKPLLDPVADRVTWDAPIHSIADIEAMPWLPKTINIKPSRFGALSNLCATYDWCEQNGIAAYGGGQSELAFGRGQIQYLASLFHADTPNDTAPGGYNNPDTPAGLPESPLEPRPDPTGFRWKS